MDVTWFGKSAIRIKTNKAIIICDPCPKTADEDMKRPLADIVTITSYEPNHSFLKGIKGDPLIIDAPGEFEKFGMHIQGFPFLTNEGSLINAYIYEAESIKMIHIGNVTPLEQLTKIEQLSNIDIAFVSLNNPKKDDPAEVSKFVRALDSKIIIPLNYNINDAADKSFLSFFNKNLALPVEENIDKFSIKKNELIETSKIIILNKKQI